MDKGRYYRHKVSVLVVVTFWGHSYQKVTVCQRMLMENCTFTPILNHAG